MVAAARWCICTRSGQSYVWKPQACQQTSARGPGARARGGGEVVYLPTRTLALLDALCAALPAHTLLAADFDALPDTVLPGTNAPLMATTVRQAPGKEARCVWHSQARRWLQPTLRAVRGMRCQLFWSKFWLLRASTALAPVFDIPALLIRRRLCWVNSRLVRASTACAPVLSHFSAAF